MILLIYDDLTDILTLYSNVVQYDQIAGPYPFHYFSTILNEHKIISLSIGGPRDCHPTQLNIIYDLLNISIEHNDISD